MSNAEFPTRREILKSAAVTGVAATGAAVKAAAATGLALPLMVVQEAAEEPPQRLIPADKGIAAEVIAALYQRGTQRAYTGEARRTIGMPCGGVGAGQLYVLGDGTLGHWGIDGEHRFSGYGAENYRTYTPAKPIEQGFGFSVTAADGQASGAILDGQDFDAIEFVGEYPVARVKYCRRADAAGGGPYSPPVSVDLEVFSPFVPLNTRESSYPATVMRFTVQNRANQRVDVVFGGWLENMVFESLAGAATIQKTATRVRHANLTSIHMKAEEFRRRAEPNPRRRVLWDFESGTYDGWAVEGAAFGEKPAAGTQPSQNPVSGFEGQRLVNSYAGSDKPTGKMTSEAFEIDLPFLTFLIGGGAHAGKTCMNLLVDGKVVRTAAGRNNEKLERAGWDVTEFFGKEGRLEIVDQHSSGWGHINVDRIELTSHVPEDLKEFDTASLGYGDMALSLVGEGEVTRWPGRDSFLNHISQLDQKRNWQNGGGVPGRSAYRNVSSLIARFSLEAGQSRDVTFIISWYFPNLHTRNGNMYSNWFKDSLDVAREIAANLDRLRRDTLLFCDTYYRETTLPWWLVTRLMMPISTLATGTCQWWKNGRFWGWEGVGCCEGTCTHVWNYSHGEAFLFPELGRSTRVMQDLGEGFDATTGLVGFRSNRNYAADGQAGTILKCYREHRLSTDDAFLKTNWPKIRLALDYLIRQDTAPPLTPAEGGGVTAKGEPPLNPAATQPSTTRTAGTPGGSTPPAGPLRTPGRIEGSSRGDRLGPAQSSSTQPASQPSPDGIIENSQHNTFDINFEGPNTFVGSLYLAALRAGEEMARLVGDHDAAAKYRGIFESGRRWTAASLFNGEYFEQRIPPGASDKWQYGTGCLSDQVFGQNWAHLLNLEHIYPLEQVRAALNAVFKYNWAPDVAALNKLYPPERWFARPGEGGLFTCTWPEGGRQKEPVRYRDEVWTGIEYQVAAGMIWESHADFLNRPILAPRRRRGDSQDHSEHGEPGPASERRSSATQPIRGPDGSGVRLQDSSPPGAPGSTQPAGTPAATRPAAQPNLLDAALLIVKAIDDRYDGVKHNPWNEVECGDHYARAMASWGVFLALTGFRYDGPAGLLGFAPRLNAKDFASFFSAAAGWGTIRQKRAEKTQSNSIELRWGTLRLATLVLDPPPNVRPTDVRVTLSRLDDVGTFSRVPSATQPSGTQSAAQRPQTRPALEAPVRNIAVNYQFQRRTRERPAALFVTLLQQVTLQAGDKLDVSLVF